MSSIAVVDPMGPLALAAKYQNAMKNGKILSIKIEFTPSGVQVQGLVPATKESPQKWVPIAEAMSSGRGQKESSVEDFPSTKLYWMKRYESRIDEEAPKGVIDAESQAQLDTAIAGIPFEKRRALQMSNSEFEESYMGFEKGVPVRRPVEDKDRIKAERAALKAARGQNTRGRGHGRGGRGQGSFLVAQSAKEVGQGQQ